MVGPALWDREVPVRSPPRALLNFLEQEINPTLLTPRSHRAATLRRSSRSSHDLKKYWIGANRGWSASKTIKFGKRWSSVGPLYDATTSNAMLTRFYYDVTQTVADRRPRLLRSHCDAATTFKIILRPYADQEDCTTMSLRWCRSYHAWCTL